MAVPPPDWAEAEAVSEYGWAFLCLFRDRAHFESFKETGSMALPKSLRQQERLRADPVRQQRARLRRAARRAQVILQRTQHRIAEAQEAVADTRNFWRWRDEEALKREQLRLPDDVAALARAERELELFDLLHAQDAECERAQE